jgi:hypothetical protein
MKLKIKSNAEDLKASLELAQGQESLNCPNKHNYSNSINNIEIKQEQEEIAEESYLYNSFKDMNIEILHVGPSEEPDRIQESKCYACKQRFLDLESYESHTENCLINHLDKFYLDSEELLREKVTEKISYNEYILRSIQSIRNISKRLFDFKYKKPIKASDNLHSSCEENQDIEINKGTPKNSGRKIPAYRYIKKKLDKNKDNFLSDHGYGSSTGSGQESKVLM